MTKMIFIEGKDTSRALVMSRFAGLAIAEPTVDMYKRVVGERA